MNSPFPFPNLGKLPEPGQPRLSVAALICFSHLRWDLVYQRPQHLLSEAVASFQVFYIEEPEFAPGAPHFRMRVTPTGVTVLTPVFDHHADHILEQRNLVRALHRSLGDGPQVHWFYTPMAMRFARNLPCDLRVYDCMDELSAFRFAPADLGALEQELLSNADLVFTGGESLFAAKNQRHPDVHCFASSVDVGHFGRARSPLPDPGDQAALPHPRIGYFGVIDERMDLALVAQAADDLPDVHFVMMGPVAKIDPADLPRSPNIHWLGRKDYADLPAYIANWDAAWMPFVLNASTRFISPTKTPEFLAAGLPVTSTAVADVVATYGRHGLVTIADAVSIAGALRDSLKPQPPAWRSAVDQCLASKSWRLTFAAMQSLMAARMPAVEFV